MRLNAGRRATAIVAVLIAAAAPAAARGADQPDQATTAFSVLAPGNGGVWGPTRPHLADQISRYDGLESAAGAGVLGAPGSAARHYKQASLSPQAVRRTETPRPGVTVEWDRDGVPFVSGATTEDASFGAGWAVAAARLDILEVMRLAGRAGLVESIGGLEGSGGGRPLINYSDAELRSGLDAMYAAAGPDAEDLREGVRGYVGGINAWLAANGSRIPWTLKLPLGLGTLGKPKPWTDLDVAAAAITINDVFGAGGGGEIAQAKVLDALTSRLGQTAGERAYDDLRRPDPTATFHTPDAFPYPLYAAQAGDPGSADGGPVDPAAIAMPDTGTPVTSADVAPVPHMSNYAVVGANRTESGRPVLIGGPQVAYFAPQIIMEIGFSVGDRRARGIVVPGLGPILIAGRTEQYAWTPTSGGSDGTDVRAELLCEPGGGAPSRASRHYIFNGECRPMTRRPGAAASTAWRTVHGPVLKWGTVGGKPVGYSWQRANRYITPVSAVGFFRMQMGKTTTPEQFVDAARLITLSLNLGYANDRDIAYAHTGAYPVRARGTRNDLPTWGTGQWEWRGPLAPTDLPYAINPPSGLLASWNNVPAPGWNDEGWWGANVRHRADAITDRFATTDTLSVDEVIARHQGASTENVEGVALGRAIEHVLGDSTAPTPWAGTARGMLKRWVAAGGQQRDTNRDWQVDAPAHALVEPLADELLTRTYRAVLGGDTVRKIPITENRPGITGSAYQHGWFSPIARELERAAGNAPAAEGAPAMCGGGTLAGCRSVVWAALETAYARTRSGQLPWVRDAPHRWRRTAAAILFIPVFTLPKPMRWQNRPTFEQVSTFGAPVG